MLRGRGTRRLSRRLKNGGVPESLFSRETCLSLLVRSASMT
jgi:hypothetical protein